MLRSYDLHCSIFVLEQFNQCCTSEVIASLMVSSHLNQGGENFSVVCYQLRAVQACYNSSCDGCDPCLERIVDCFDPAAASDFQCMGV
jgi:hypothetical protein